MKPCMQMCQWTSVHTRMFRGARRDCVVAVVLLAMTARVDVAVATCPFELVQVEVPAPQTPEHADWNCSLTPTATFTKAVKSGSSGAFPTLGAYTPVVVTTATFLYRNFTRSLLGQLPDGREVLTPIGPIVFAARFAPPSAGTWEYGGPPLFVNSDAFVNTAHLHTRVPLECSWYDSHQHWWCVRLERNAELLSVWTLLHQCMRCSHLHLRVYKHPRPQVHCRPSCRRCCPWPWVTHRGGVR